MKASDNHSIKVLPKMTIMKNDRMSVGGYYRDAYGLPGESEGSGSSGRIDPEITASEDSSTPARKCIGLNSDKCSTYGVPVQVLSSSSMLSSERNDLLQKLRLELEQIRMVQKKVEFQKTNGIAVSASSDILSYSNGKQQQGSFKQNFGKSSLKASGPGKKVNPSSALGDKMHGLKRDMSGRFESAKQGSTPNTANIMLMKQCENLLKRLMSHQFGWVFNHPVDYVKLNLPDYLKVIKHPMDLGTIKTKIASGAYATPLEFVADVRLTFSNAMTYNPPGNDVHIMSDTLRKFLEVRWKNIEKKIPATSAIHSVQPKSRPPEVMETSKIMPPAKKRKTSSIKTDIITEPFKRKMTDEEKNNLGRELESLIGEMPLHIIDFLKAHSSNGGEPGGEEIEIDVDDLGDDTLFRLRELLDDYLLQKQKKQPGGEPCEIELLNESGLSNSSMQQGKENDPDDEDIDIGNELPGLSYPPVEIEKDTCLKSTKSVNSSSSRDSESSSPESESKGQEHEYAGSHLREKENDNNPLERNQSVSGLDQLEQNFQSKPSSVESDSRQDELGESAPSERRICPEKRYRAALLKNRFADTILKAREKTLTQGEKGDPEKLRREREKLELKIRKEAKAAEDARIRAEAEEARSRRELEREAARQALLQMEKSVEINENSRFLNDLEMLRSGPPEQLLSSVDETSPEHSLDALGSFNFGSCNPLEQLGLYMKDDEEEEEGEPPSVPAYANDMEEGEID